MKARHIVFLIIVALFAGCAAEEAKAGDPIEPRRARKLRILKMRSTPAAEPVQTIEVEEEVEKTVMVPVEKTITVLEPETIIETKIVETEVMAEEPSQMFSGEPVRKALKKRIIRKKLQELRSNIDDRIAERKESRRTVVFILEK